MCESFNNCSPGTQTRYTYAFGGKFLRILIYTQSRIVVRNHASSHRTFSTARNRQTCLMLSILAVWFRRVQSGITI